MSVHPTWTGSGSGQWGRGGGGGERDRGRVSLVQGRVTSASRRGHRNVNRGGRRGPPNHEQSLCYLHCRQLDEGLPPVLLLNFYR